ncbi:hypothetical protein POM88_012368 [Heracleum sosnowskyi]|uniref:Uncharacterized protein n=1 Tax=Heracleum sosnowskyi TaxID=360622 RepID=A0AAD8IZT8_9APIA|nr:hypothetical protein POM88_012368 [Heracleum sosnowskyi]
MTAATSTESSAIGRKTAKRKMTFSTEHCDQNEGDKIKDFDQNEGDSDYDHAFNYGDGDAESDTDLIPKTKTLNKSQVIRNNIYIIKATNSLHRAADSSNQSKKKNKAGSIEIHHDDDEDDEEIYDQKKPRIGCV